MMLATIPNHPNIAGTTSWEINSIEYASVPMENKICANEKLELFVLRILRPNSIKEFFFGITSTWILFCYVEKSPVVLFIVELDQAFSYSKGDPNHSKY
jgi:hypothetical protein